MIHRSDRRSLDESKFVVVAGQDVALSVALRY